MTAQRLILTGEYPDGIWTCAWCAAKLANGVITHRDDCRWTAEIAAAEHDRIIGYKIAGKAYHPADVVIVRKDTPHG